MCYVNLFVWTTIHGSSFSPHPPGSAHNLLINILSECYKDWNPEWENLRCCKVSAQKDIYSWPFPITHGRLVCCWRGKEREKNLGHRNVLVLWHLKWLPLFTCNSLLEIPSMSLYIFPVKPLETSAVSELSMVPLKPEHSDYVTWLHRSSTLTQDLPCCTGQRLIIC